MGRRPPEPSQARGQAVVVRAVVTGEQTPEQAGQAAQDPEKAAYRLFRASGRAGWSARGSPSSKGGGEEWSNPGLLLFGSQPRSPNRNSA